MQPSFILKGEGIKSDISWFRSDSGGSVLISSSLQSFTGGPGRDVSSELNKGIFMPITWEAGFPEMGH